VNVEGGEWASGRGGCMGGQAAIARIDSAIAASAYRNAFSRDQALRTLSDVEARVGDPIVADRVAEVVNEAAASYFGAAVVDGERFLDTLLDLRMLLVTLAWSTDAT